MTHPLNKFERRDNEVIHTRFFRAPRQLVWEAWTKTEHLEKWWGPDGFTISTHNLSVAPKGNWNFLMTGHGKEYPNQVVYQDVVEPERLSFRNGDPADKYSFMVYVEFKEHPDGTVLTMRTVLQSAAILDELDRTVGAIEGGKQTLNKLETYLQARMELQLQLKQGQSARTSTYLNFPGNTETAFLFYKSVFRTEFSGKGIQRFGDLPASAEHPPLSDEDKKLILHIELPILGGHVLMATDAPESMGFKVQAGNNMYINLEPDSREETKRLFTALSEDGTVTMELQDMFWGAYYGSCTDRFGINWMFNYNSSN